MKPLNKLLAAVTIACGTGAVAAAPIPLTINSYSLSGLSGFSIVETANGINETVAAGQISISTNIGSFETYCMDVLHDLTVPQSYLLDPTYTNDEISRLFFVSGFDGAGVGSDTNKAALQLAIWEAVYDPGNLNLTTGDFMVTGGDAAAIAQAGTFLTSAGQLGAGTYPTALGKFTSSLAEGPISQTLITAVPEPGTYALMLAGLAGVGFVARRRTPARN